jgi:alkanesulfonate monooxygenase SsuD/methylene tetrahydromethanopterin reductase-like flavin-dependent oxidoreductase (luciferase family)
VGRGYHSREVETFGAPMLDAEANRDLFEEQVDIIMKAFTSESFSHRGKHYTLPPAVPYRGYDLEEITLVPRPVRQPVECWQPIVSAGARGLDFMIKHGIKGLEHVHLSNSMGTPQNVMLEQLAWLGKEVMPLFRGRR